MLVDWEPVRIRTRTDGSNRVEGSDVKGPGITCSDSFVELCLGTYLLEAADAGEDLCGPCS